MKKNGHFLPDRGAVVLSGLLGCLCFGAGDWLMIWGNPAAEGRLSWLTLGTAQIPQWRYSLAMALAFPGILFYGAALFSMGRFIREAHEKKVYGILNAFGLCPWIALHLFYVMILSLFSWMHANGYQEAALPVCEGLFSQLSWVIPLSEGVMLPVFVYWLWLVFREKTVFPAWLSASNVLPVFAMLKGISLLMPASAFSLAFTNGLMSESMAVSFLCMLVPEAGKAPGERQMDI